MQGDPRHAVVRFIIPVTLENLVTVLIGVASFGFLWWVSRRVTTGVPSKRQAAKCA